MMGRALDQARPRGHAAVCIAAPQGLDRRGIAAAALAAQVRCRSASNRLMPAATDTFRLSMPEAMGIFAR